MKKPSEDDKRFAKSVEKELRKQARKSALRLKFGRAKAQKRDANNIKKERKRHN